MKDSPPTTLGFGQGEISTGGALTFLGIMELEEIAEIAGKPGAG